MPKTAATCLYLYSALAGIVSDLDARVQGVTMAFVQNIEHPMCERLQNTLAHSLTLESTPGNGRPFDRPLVLCRLGEPLFSDLFAAKVRFLFQHMIDRAHVDDIGGGNLMLVLAAETPQPDIDSFFKRKHRLRQGKLREAGARRG